MEPVIVTQPGFSAMAGTKFEAPLLEGAGDTPQDEGEKEKKKKRNDKTANIFTEPPIVISPPYIINGSNNGGCHGDDCRNCDDCCSSDCDDCCSCDCDDYLITCTIEPVIETQPGFSAIAGAKFEESLLEGAGDTPQDEVEKEKKMKRNYKTGKIIPELPVFFPPPYVINGSNNDCCHGDDGDDCCTCEDCCAGDECNGCDCGDCDCGDCDCNCGDCTIL